MLLLNGPVISRLPQPCTKETRAIQKTASDWNPQGYRRGRPKRTWRRTTEDEIRSTRRSWNEVKGIAGDRNAWKLFVDALYCTRIAPGLDDDNRASTGALRPWWQPCIHWSSAPSGCVVFYRLEHRDHGFGSHSVRDVHLRSVCLCFRL